jgi:hypothetical protein
MRCLQHPVRLAIFGILWALSIAAHAQATLEYPVKAAFLVRFGDYVDWPASAFASASAPLVVCVVGEDPFGAALDKAAGNQLAHGRPIVVRRSKAVTAASGCHIAFIEMADAARLEQQLDALRGAPVLTVTDGKSGGAGIINFVVRQERVRFDIDDEAAGQRGLDISSKVLGLALNVRPRKAPR